MKRPNILFIMTDQQRADALGCSGGWVNTPNIDRLAAEGVRFSNCITTTPICIPARVTMATGQYPHENGIWDNCHHRMSEDNNTWMQCLQQAGYRTSVFGKTHLHPHGDFDLRDEVSLMNALGIDDVDEIGGPRACRRTLCNMTELWNKKGIWQDYKDEMQDRYANDPTVVRPSAIPLEDYADCYVGRRAKEYLENYNDIKPWFCWVSFGGPHEPWDTPEPYFSMYKPEDMPKPINGKMSKEMPERYHKKQAAFENTPEHVAEMRANYAGNITLIDDQIGEILKVLEKRNELDNTIITFTSDHGEMNGDFGLVYKSMFMNSAVRVPMIIRTPKTIKSKNAGALCEGPCEWADLGPTLLELTDTDLTYQQSSLSLVPSVENPEHEIRTSALSEQYEEYMLLTKTWKAMFNKEQKLYALFDLTNDPNECHNLVNSKVHASLQNTAYTELKQRLGAYALAQ